ncbi:MAG: helix-turn-helix domain-containing protein [Bacteroidota bacterium]
MDFANFIVSAGIIQAILLIGLLISRKKTSFPLYALIFLLLGLLYFQWEFILVRNAISFPYKQILLTRHGGWLMIGPLFFAFIQSLYSQQDARKLLLHLLPFIVLTLILPLFLHQPIPKRGFDYSMLTVFVYSDLGLTPINSFYGGIFLFQFLHVGIYLLMSYRFVQNQPQQIPLPISQQSLGIFSLIYLCSVIFYGVLVTQTFYKRDWDYFLILPMAVFVYYLSYLLLSRPEWWRSDLKKLSDKKYQKSVLSNKDLHAILEQVDQVVHQQRWFVQADLSLESIAKETGLSRHHISQALNQEKGMSFSQYINQLRVEEAQHLIREDQDHSTLLTIAFQAGFQTKASFNHHFKRITGLTPSQFKKNL